MFGILQRFNFLTLVFKICEHEYINLSPSPNYRSFLVTHAEGKSGVGWSRTMIEVTTCKYKIIQKHFSNVVLKDCYINIMAVFTVAT
jgi:hypothetical protein